MHNEDSAEADLAVEILIKESERQWSEVQARSRLRYVLPWDIYQWMASRLPDLPSRSERLLALRYATEVADLRGGPSENRNILLEVLRERLDLSDDDLAFARETVPTSGTTTTEFSGVEPAGGGDWETSPFLLLGICQLLLPVIDLYTSGTAQWHYARESFYGSLGGQVSRPVAFYLLSEAARWVNENKLEPIYRGFDTGQFGAPEEESLSLLRVAVGIALVEPKITRKKRKTLRALARNLSVSENVVEELLDEWSAEFDAGQDDGAAEPEPNLD